MLKQNHTWVSRQRHRWLRPDAHRWLRTDHCRFDGPAERKAGFNPEQPRDEEGRWVETGAEEEMGENAPDRSPLDEYSDASRVKGHHFVAQSIHRNLPLSPEAKAIFDLATTGPLLSGPHGWSREHDLYNKAIGEQLTRFMTSNGISPETMTERQAKSFVEGIRQSTDPRIRDFNLNIYRRELRFLLRFGPRRSE